MSYPEVPDEEVETDLDNLSEDFETEEEIIRGADENPDDGLPDEEELPA